MGVVWSDDDMNSRETATERYIKSGKRKYREVYTDSDEVADLREDFMDYSQKKKKRSHREQRDKYFSDKG